MNKFVLSILVLTISASMVCAQPPVEPKRKSGFKLADFSLHGGRGFSEALQTGYGARVGFALGPTYRAAVFYTHHEGTEEYFFSGPFGSRWYSEQINFLGAEIGPVIRRKDLSISPFLFLGKGFGGKKEIITTDIPPYTYNRRDRFDLIGGVGLSMLIWKWESVGFGPELRYSQWQPGPGALGAYFSVVVGKL